MIRHQTFLAVILSLSIVALNGCASNPIASPTVAPLNTGSAPSDAEGIAKPAESGVIRPDNPSATVNGIVVASGGGVFRGPLGPQDMGLPVTIPAPGTKPERPQGWYGVFRIIAGPVSDTGPQITLDPGAMWASDTLGDRHPVSYTEVAGTGGVTAGVVVIRMPKQLPPHTMALQIESVFARQGSSTPTRVNGPWRVELYKQFGRFVSGSVGGGGPKEVAGISVLDQGGGIGRGGELVFSRSGAVVARGFYRMIDPTGEVRVSDEAEVRRINADRSYQLATPKPPITAVPLPTSAAPTKSFENTQLGPQTKPSIPSNTPPVPIAPPKIGGPTTFTTPATQDTPKPQAPVKPAAPPLAPPPGTAVQPGPTIAGTDAVVSPAKPSPP